MAAGLHVALLNHMLSESSTVRRISWSNCWSFKPLASHRYISCLVTSVWMYMIRMCTITPIRSFSGCCFELIAGLQVELGLERVDLIGGNGRDDVNEGVDDGSMLEQIEG